jgi:hypothetical protein
MLGFVMPWVERPGRGSTGPFLKATEADSSAEPGHDSCCQLAGTTLQDRPLATVHSLLVGPLMKAAVFACAGVAWLAGCAADAGFEPDEVTIDDEDAATGNRPSADNRGAARTAVETLEAEHGHAIRNPSYSLLGRWGQDEGEVRELIRVRYTRVADGSRDSALVNTVAIFGLPGQSEGLQIRSQQVNLIDPGGRVIGDPTPACAAATTSALLALSEASFETITIGTVKLLANVDGHELIRVRFTFGPDGSGADRYIVNALPDGLGGCAVWGAQRVGEQVGLFDTAP